MCQFDLFYKKKFLTIHFTFTTPNPLSRINFKQNPTIKNAIDTSTKTNVFAAH